MSDKYLEAEKKLALLLHPYLKDTDQSVLSDVLEMQNCAWCRDDGAAFRLMAKHHLFPSSHELSDSIMVGDHLEYYENHPDRNTTIRYAIVMAVIEKLQGA